MTCTYLVGWLGLSLLSAPDAGLAAAPGVTTEIDSGAAAASRTLVTGSLHLGAGSLDGDAAVLLRPRFAWVGARAELALSAPIWLEPPASRGQPLVWLSDWRAARTYGGLVERLHLELWDAHFLLSAGTLAQQTLGHGALVDRFHNQRDPYQPRLGARTEVAGERFIGVALLDDVTRPAVVASRFAVAPLAGADPEARWWTAVELAVDLRAPRRAGRAPFGALAIDTSYALFRGPSSELAVYGVWATTSRLATGAHLGTELRWRGRDRASRHGLLVRLELVASGADYVPGYFDEVYVWERGGFSDAALPKAIQHTRAALGVRSQADVELGPAHFGFAAAIADPRAPASVTTYLRVDGERLALAFYLTERRVSRMEDLVAVHRSTHASVELAYLFYEGLSAFTQARHGPRPGAAGLEAAVDWVFGLGYGAQNGQTPG